ncbi:MAG: hypothetical protein ACXW1W_01525 [Methylococcaceae bacterium]
MTETTTDTTAPTTNCPVSSFNEWDPLEEVIVGRLECATLPPDHVSIVATVPEDLWDVLAEMGGQPYPQELINAAQVELDEFIHILEAEGIAVKRPEIIDFTQEYKTPNWTSRGLCTACPRDGILIVGDEIIETPMAWRSRYFEMDAYRSLLMDYFRQGAKWTSAPRPRLLDTLYNDDYQVPTSKADMQYVINESEIVFDAADFVRCGRDLFVTQSNVTNAAGIEWLSRHLAPKYRIHRVESTCKQPMHIDSSFMPLAPGKLLVNPDYIDINNIPAIFKGWDIMVAPKPDIVQGGALFDNASMCSMWISINMLMLDEKRVVIEKNQTTMIRFLKQHGFEPIPCAFMNFAPFGGSFHCATLDIRRNGELQSYF